MMAHSIKYNFGLNLINTILGLLFPIITFPYISRVLNPEGVGLVTFYSSIINYVILLTSLGIPLYAIREISRVRHNIENRNKVTAEILLLHLALTFVGYLIVGILSFTVDRIYAHLLVFLILSLSIGFTTIGVNWFYQGIEDFKYITIRSVIVKLISLATLFIFVRNSSDIVGYAIVTVLSTVGNNILNFLRLRKYFSEHHVTYSQLQITRHLKPSLKIFLINLITSIYLNLDSVMLGFMKDDFIVGLYAASSRITHVLTTIISSLGNVLLPRLSNYIATGKWVEFSALKDKAIRFTFTIALPIVFGLIIVAPEFIRVFAGEKYIEAIPTLRIMAPIIFLIGLSGILGLQILYSLGKENLVIICTGVGATANFIINILLIPSLNQNGAAIATVVAELLVLSVMMIIGRRYISYNYLNRQTLCIVISMIVMTVFIALIHISLTGCINDFCLLILEIFIGVIVYAAMLIVTRNELFIDMLQSLTQRYRNRHIK